MLISKLEVLIKYIHYYLTAQNKHDIHSPFVYKLVTDIINNKGSFYAYKPIEIIRSQLLRDNRNITINDFGAGSILNSSKKRKVKDIARNSAKSIKYGQLLFRLVDYFQPNKMLELGTSLGISTLYQAMPKHSAKLITLEGCKETASIAQENFNKLKLPNIKILLGDFAHTLSLALQELGELDYAFFDGNHTKEATLQYFEECLPFIHNNTLFVFDDIHWSRGMEDAWKIIKDNSKVTVSVDLFFLGLIFFRKEQSKQDFTIRF